MPQGANEVPTPLAKDGRMTMNKTDVSSRSSNKGYMTAQHVTGRSQLAMAPISGRSNKKNLLTGKS